DPATRYNQLHPDQVAEFNRLTGNACADGKGGVDVAKVKRWQGSHGLDDDGEVGPATVAAAGRKDPPAQAPVVWKPGEPGEPADDSQRFHDAVYRHHLVRAQASGRSFCGQIADHDLMVVEDGERLRKDIAPDCKALLAAARADLAADRASGKALAKQC